jgi:hypothetical protein
LWNPLLRKGRAEMGYRVARISAVNSEYFGDYDAFALVADRFPLAFATRLDVETCLILAWCWTAAGGAGCASV